MLSVGSKSGDDFFRVLVIMLASPALAAASLRVLGSIPYAKRLVKTKDGQGDYAWRNAKLLAFMALVVSVGYAILLLQAMEGKLLTPEIFDKSDLGK